jgi:hypothetical protein
MFRFKVTIAVFCVLIIIISSLITLVSCTEESAASNEQAKSDVFVFDEQILKYVGKKAKLEAWESKFTSNPAAHEPIHAKMTKLKTDIAFLEQRLKVYLHTQNLGHIAQQTADLTYAEVLLKNKLDHLKPQYESKKFEELKKLEMEQVTEQIKQKMKDPSISPEEKQRLKVEKLNIQLQAKKAAAEYAEKLKQGNQKDEL